MRAPHTQSPQGPQDRHASQEITEALVALRDHAPGARQDVLDRLAPLVYGELRKVAHRQLGAERAGHTLSTTALVHEAYLRLVDQTRAEWTDRAHFFAVAARAMRRILVDYARRHRALRRGGGWRPLSLESLADGDAGAMAAAERADELMALDEALERLAALDERLSRVVECRFFAGLTEAETAEVLGVTPRTVARDWVKARGWLHRELRGDDA
jgi:RNA polymerase sigma factor (TIGR02999 family)